MEVCICYTAQNIQLFIKDFFEPAGLLTFNEEINNGKLHFLRSVKNGTGLKCAVSERLLDFKVLALCLYLTHLKIHVLKNEN